MLDGRKAISDDATEYQTLCMNVKYESQKVLLQAKFTLYNLK